MLKNSNCNLCELSEQAGLRRSTCVMQEPYPADVMIVAENVSPTDDLNDTVFTGKVLKEIKQFFESEGLTVYCTYATKCMKPGRTYKILDKSIKVCSEAYLASELKAVSPKHIICLGAGAMYGACKKKGITDKRGTRFLDDKLQAYIYPTLHPAQAAYDESKKQMMKNDLTRFLHWIKGEVDPASEHKKFDPPVYEVSTLRGLRKIQRLMREHGTGIVAVDTETSGLNAYDPNGYVRMIQFCWDTEFGGVYVPLQVGDGCYFDTVDNPAPAYWQDESLEDALDIIQEILAENYCVWHNGKFDRIWLNLWGKRTIGRAIKAPHIGMDTMHVAHLLNENRAMGLKSLITEELGYETYNIPDKLTKNLAMLFPYAAKDTVASFLLYQKYSDNLTEPGFEKMRRFYNKVIRRVDAVYTKMELKGWPVHEDRALAVHLDLQAKLEKTEKAMQQWLEDQGYGSVDPKVFSSPIQLSRLLFNSPKDETLPGLGLMPNPDECLARTASGGLSTNENALIHLKGHAFIDLLLDRRGICKGDSTYVEPMLKASRARGRLTTSHKIAGPVTGRTASGKEGRGKTASGMNLQNLPHDDGLVVGIKTIIKPREGRCIVESDLGQAELRIAGELSGDPLFIQSYQNGVDIHALRGQRMLRLDDETWADLKKTDPKAVKSARQKAKAVNFGFVYGMGASKFKIYAKTDYGVEFSMQECNDIRSGFFRDHAGLEPWYKKQERDGKRQGYVESLSGRRRHLPNLQLNPETSGEARTRYGDAVRQAVNCVDMKTEALTKRGWIKGGDLRKDDIIMTKNIETGLLEWQTMIDLKVYPGYIGEMVEFRSKSFNAVSTPNHRWMVYNKATGRNECKITSEISNWGDHRIHRTGDYISQTSMWTDDEVELIGWVLTDGFYRTDRKRVSVCQVKKKNIPSIDSLFSRFMLPFGRHTQKKTGQVIWGLSGCLAQRITAICPERVVTMNLLDQLSTDQLHLLRRTMMKGDGTSAEKDTFFCGKEAGASVFQVLCTLTGFASSTVFRDMSMYRPISSKMSNIPISPGYWVTNILKRDKAQVIKCQKKVITDNIGVWCPIVSNTYFVARREGQVFITGNTPVQGFASDIKLMSLIEIDELLDPKRGFIIGEVHDSIIMECDEDYALEAAQIAVNVMRHPRLLDVLGIHLTVPIDADAKIGPSLGEAKEVEGL